MPEDHQPTSTKHAKFQTKRYTVGVIAAASAGGAIDQLGLLSRVARHKIVRSHSFKSLQIMH